MSSAAIDKLPNELLFQVFSDVTDIHRAPPSAVNFSLQPSADLTSAADQPLKTISLVCRGWRDAIIPTLFKHARVTIDRHPRWLRLCTGLSKQLKSNYKKTPRSIDLIRQIDRLAQDVECTDEKRVLGLSFVVDDYESLPGEYLHWLPSLQLEAASFLEFLETRNLARKVKTLVVMAHNDLTDNRSSFEDSLIHREVKALWREVFRRLSFNEITVAAPPSTMAALSGAGDRDWDSWLFRMPYHYLKLSKNGSTKDESTPSSPASPGCRGRETFLYNIASWDRMAYNEGTCLRGYGHYEYHWKTPPRILETLIQWLVKERMSPRTPKIQAVDYICSFPYASHVAKIAYALLNLKHLREFHVKLADPDLLDDAELLGKAQPSDVYAEWQFSYANLVHHFMAKAPNGTILTSCDTKHATLKDQVHQSVQAKCQTFVPPLRLTLHEQDGISTWTVEGKS
jgi:hypothetical protein